MSDELRAEIAQDLRDAVMGDEAALNRLSDVISSGAAPPQPPPPSPAELAYRQAASRIQYANRVRTLAKAENFTHMLHGSPNAQDDYVELAQKLDVELAARYPTMDEIERARHVLERVQKIKGDPDRSDDADYFAMRRRQNDPFAPKAGQAENQLEYDEPLPDEEDEEAQMTRDYFALREQHNLDNVEVAKRTRDRVLARSQRR